MARAPRPALIGAVQQAIDAVLFWSVLATLVLCCMGWSLPALPLRALLPRRLGVKIGQFTAMMWCRIFLWYTWISGRIDWDLSALDGLRTEERLIIAPNHPSLIDALLVISRLPNITCIAKASLWNNLFFGAGIRLAGYIRNDSPRQLLRASAAAIRAPGRMQMLIFPEGTRSVPGLINPFQPGFAAIARLAGADIQTVFIETNSAYMSKGWPVTRMPSFPVVYRARLGRRFPPSGNAKALTAELEDYFRQEFPRPDRPRE